MPATLGWPHCHVCGKPLSFIWQINFADFGVAAFASQGLFQFFYCWLCFPIPPQFYDFHGDIPPLTVHESYTADSPNMQYSHEIYDFNSLCRWYPDFKDDEAEIIPQSLCPDLDEMTAMFIMLENPLRVEVIPFLSVPSADSSDCLVPQESQEEPLNVEGDTFYELYGEIDGFHFHDNVSQIGGYPVWEQSEETPKCPTCGQRAELVGAIGSDETGLIWGDTGYWYFFACVSTEECPG